ncbi:hypothetical protein ACVMHW_007504 [Bradyrhizobium diazoefficiens]
MGSTKRRISQGAGDTVDLRPRPGHPDGASLGVAGRQLAGVEERQLGLLPALETAVERLGLNAKLAEPGRGALRKLGAAQAGDDDGAAREGGAPVGNVLVAEPDGAGDQPPVGGKVLLGPHVDQDRSVGRADQARQFIG